ncbi:MAG: hypothetical protein XFASWVDF_002411, partial [Candidatus Fervidibacter sp.]
MTEGDGGAPTFRLLRLDVVDRRFRVDATVAFESAAQAAGANRF